MFSASKNSVTETKKVEPGKMTLQTAQRHKKIVDTHFLCNNTKLTFERAVEVYHEAQRLPVLYIHNQNPPKQIVMGHTNEEVCFLSDNKHVLSYRPTKVGKEYEGDEEDEDEEQDEGVVISLWNIDTSQKVKSIIIEDEFLEYDGLRIIAAADYFILLYNSKDGGKHDVVELYDALTLEMISRKKAWGVFSFSCSVSPFRPDLFFFQKADGFEFWQIKNKKIKKVDQVVYPQHVTKSCFTLLADGKTVASQYDEGKWWFWRLGNKLNETTLISSFSVGVDFNLDDQQLIAIPDAKHLVSFNNYTAFLWDISDINKPFLVNKCHSSNMLGYGQVSFTENWGIITRLNVIIEFPEISASFEVYKSNLCKVLCSENYVNVPPRSVDDIILSYCFFKSPQVVVPMDTDVEMELSMSP